MRQRSPETSMLLCSSLWEGLGFRGSGLRLSANLGVWVEVTFMKGSGCRHLTPVGLEFRHSVSHDAEASKA